MVTRILTAGAEGTGGIRIGEEVVEPAVTAGLGVPALQNVLEDEADEVAVLVGALFSGAEPPEVTGVGLQGDEFGNER
ncbi:hypothetical protein GCM10010339_87190 [Streptomyces alanosinicus]|uniref:Uncharacterized protein n=1 Tax=Streptomyces alanosinicus TaxID=68171 RepID=A0A918YT52_9ACTN|nr:hypothetical protein GCM10010339_87190 [Streptomyces alanosinicus]